MAVASSLAPPRIVYTDLSRTYDEGNSSMIERNAAVIHWELVNLFTTLVGDVEFEPELGSSLPTRLFDPKDSQTAYHLEHDLYLSIQRWMNARIRINQDGVVVRTTDDYRGFDVTLSYELIGLGITVESSIRIVQ